MGEYENNNDDTGRTSSRPSSPSNSFTTSTLLLKGHLFDNGILTDVLNKVEEINGKARVLSLKLGASVDEVSEARVQLRIKGESLKDQLISKIEKIEGVIVSS